MINIFKKIRNFLILKFRKQETLKDWIDWYIREGKIKKEWLYSEPDYHSEGFYQYNAEWQEVKSEDKRFIG
jgi:hypothetical protein